MKDEILQHYSGYSKEEITPIVHSMIDYLQQGRVKHEAFHKKYAAKKFLKGTTSWISCFGYASMLTHLQHHYTREHGQRSTLEMCPRHCPVGRVREDPRPLLSHFDWRSGDGLRGSECIAIIPALWGLRAVPCSSGSKDEQVRRA